MITVVVVVLNEKNKLTMQTLYAEYQEEGKQWGEEM